MKITNFAAVPQYLQHGRYEVDMMPNWLVTKVEEWVREEGLQLDPDFQRGHVWTEKQQVAYVEFFLKGGKTARVIYFNFPSWHRSAQTAYNDFVIVDGKQRLEAWRRFLNNEIEVFGSLFREFTDQFDFGHTLRVHINDLPTKADVLQWYIDFNAGGIAHTDEEIDKVKKLLEKDKK